MNQLRRPTNSAAEISALPPLGSTQCSAHIRERGNSFAPETLVYLMREAILRRDTATVELSARLLVGRSEPTGQRWEGGHCEGTIVKLARYYGFSTDGDLRRDFRGRCLTELVESVYAGREEKPYWEERFGDAFKRSCIDVARSINAARKREKQFVASDNLDEASDVDRQEHSAELIDEAIMKKMASPQHVSVMMKAIRALPKRQAHAALLAWVEGRAVEGEGEETVAALMGGISPRAVYKHLANARANLSADPRIRAIWFGEV